jgi:hypothetical protein
MDSLFLCCALAGNDTTRLNVTLDVITGLVPVVPMLKSAAPHRIGMAGTSPAMATEDVISDSQEGYSEESHALQHLATPCNAVSRLLQGVLQGCCKALLQGEAVCRVFHHRCKENRSDFIICADAWLSVSRLSQEE